MAAVAASVSHAADFSLVLAGGRVIDPESGLDGVRNVGVIEDRIARISEEPLAGVKTINVHGLVVAPGFIDLHNHSPTPLGQRYQAHDGVTTALELEAGRYPVDQIQFQLRGGSVQNYGASAGYSGMRNRLFGSFEATATRTPDAKERAALRNMLLEGLDQGGIGIGLPLDYISEGTDYDEVRALFQVAGERQAPIFVHIRRGVNGDPAGLREALGLARETGAPLHICHITHNAMVNTDLFLREIRAAQADGVDVTTELLPYPAGSTGISAAVFGRDWRTIFNIDHSDVEWGATGERFTSMAMFEEYREKYPSGLVIHHYLDEAWNRRAVVEPGVMIVSDMVPMTSEGIKVAPHNGAFSRVLGRYVRKERLISLTTALSKMTLLPAQRLESAAPDFESKGRLQEGMDADITVFDPETVLDRATYQNPFQPSAGIHYVLVNGVLVIDDGKFVANTFPGRQIYGDL